MNTTETNPLQEGDCVILNSGSPFMTVTFVEEDDDDRLMATACWATKTGEIHTDEFPVICLRKISKEYIEREFSEILV